MTLASHANAALRARAPLRLPAHPAFMVVRRSRLLEGDGVADTAAWFERVQAGGGPVLLADAGVDGEAVVVTPALGWRVGKEGGGVVVAPCERREPVSLAFDAATALDAATAFDAATALDAATDVLRSAAVAAREIAGHDAPRLWAESVDRAVAILESDGTGEELSDVAWPHFLLPSDYPPAARRLAAAAATLWLWEGPGSWTGDVAERAHGRLRDAVSNALVAAVNTGY